MLWIISTRIPVLATLLLCFVLATATVDDVCETLDKWAGAPGSGGYEPIPPPLPALAGRFVPGQPIFGGTGSHARPPLTVGSTKAEVLALFGTPNESEDEVWVYGSSKIYFKGDRVAAWSSSPDLPLRADQAANGGPANPGDEILEKPTGTGGVAPNEGPPSTRAKNAQRGKIRETAGPTPPPAS